MKCLVRALADGARRPLFIEDDVEIGDPARLAQAMAELPADWDVLYLGGHPRSDTRRHSANLLRVGTFSFAEAYLLNGKALRPFIDFWLDRVGQPPAMYDLVLGEFASMTNGFCVYTTLTRQPPGPSQISYKDEDKKVGWRAPAERPDIAASDKVTTKYFSEQEKADSKVSFDSQGRMLDAKGKPVAKGSKGFVMDPKTKALHQFDTSHVDVLPEGKKKTQHHSSPLSGGKVAGAGVIETGNQEPDRSLWTEGPRASGRRLRSAVLTGGSRLVVCSHLSERTGHRGSAVPGAP